MRRLLDYAMAALGPISTAGTQFLLSLLLLRHLAPAAFGNFSFLFVVSALAIGVWSALFAAPLLVLLTHADAEGSNARQAGALIGASVLATLASLPVFAGIALLVGSSTAEALYFAAFAALGLVRALGRAHSYARGTPYRTVASDVVYALVLLGATAGLAWTARISVAAAYLAMLIATLVALAPFGLAYLSQLLSTHPLADLRSYRAVWNKHGRWALVGVVSTEATVNAHAYLVTAIAGAAAYAPIAATQLLVRPVTTALNALMEFERSRMARSIGAGAVAPARAQMRHFRVVVLMLWLGTLAVAAGLLWLAPRLVFPAQYPLPVLVAGTLLWFAVMAVRVIRAPESALLQAAGEFRPLAMASVWSCFVSVGVVLAIILLAAPLWSIGGVLAGELVLMYWLWRTARRWLRATDLSDPA
jgi:O-antigen/teichoic acid export membrane protein